jgi:hypothetical protein
MASNKTAWKTVLPAMLVGAGAAVAGYWFGKQGLQMPWLRASVSALSGWDALALPALLLLVIAVHEAGHLLGGMSHGMRFLLFIVGPFGWVRSGDGIRFRWFFSLGSLGGVASAMPVPDRPLLPQLQRLVLGGPLASLVLAVLAALAAASSEGRLAAYAVGVAVLSTGIFLVTAAPFKAGGFMSDGMQFLQLRRNPAMVERRVRLLAVAGLSMAGTRPSELDDGLLEQARALVGDEPMFDVGVWLYSYAQDLDRGNAAAAGLWLDRIKPVFDQYPDGFRQAIAIELALFESLYRNNASEAAAWMARAGGGVVDSSRRWLARASLAVDQGRIQEAGQALDQAEADLGRAMDPGLARLGSEQIARLRARLAASDPAEPWV